MMFNEEHLLLIGGQFNFYTFSDAVHRYNGKWSFRGNLQKKRARHSSVFLNGRVLIIGGKENSDNLWTKTEIWHTSKSKIETELTWPELNYWDFRGNPVFIIPEYINP